MYTELNYYKDAMRLCCKFLKVEMTTIKSRLRYKRILMPRYICYYVAREISNMTLPEIGYFFNREDYSIMAGIRKLKKNPEALETAKVIIEFIRETLPNPYEE